MDPRQKPSGHCVVGRVTGDCILLSNPTDFASRVKPRRTQRVDAIGKADQVNEVTHILNVMQQGDAHAAEQLLPLVYEELRQLASRKLAHEAPGQTLNATALVHEAYLRLVDAENTVHWDSRGYVIGFAAAGAIGMQAWWP